MNNKWKILISLIVIAMTSVAGIILWDKLPAQLPVHFNLNNEPDNFMPKAGAIFGIPAFLMAIQLLCLLDTHIQFKKNGQVRKYLPYIIWLVPAIAIFVMGSIIMFSLDIKFNLTLFVSIFLGVLFVILGNVMPKVTQNMIFGIRIYWTLKNEDNWFHTHRVGGFVFVIGGLLMIFTSLMENIYVTTTLLIAMAITPIAYSWIYALRHK